MLTLIVLGKYQVKNIDIYLEPLIDELMFLWNKIQMIDMSRPILQSLFILYEYEILCLIVNDYLGLTVYSIMYIYNIYYMFMYTKLIYYKYLILFYQMIMYSLIKIITGLHIKDHHAFPWCTKNLTPRYLNHLKKMEYLGNGKYFPIDYNF